VQNPVVDVKILNKEITILGEVRTPGVVKIDKDRNQLMELIARCSGFEFYANLKKIKVLRQVGVDVAVTNIDLTKADHLSQRNLYLLPGDVVIIPSKRYKEFDKRISVIIPLTTTVSAAAIIMGLF
jgi:polysaccharide export outer membrane protein